MKLGLRAKLFATSVLLVLAGVLAAGLFLELELRDRVEHQIEQELARHVQSVRELLAVGDADGTIASVDRLADRMGAALGVRVTVMDATGLVAGDSQLAAAEIPAVENHADRPEVRDALTGGFGESRRYSTTVDNDLLYVAIPLGSDHPGWVARVARPLSEVDDAIGRLRRQMLVAGAIALLAAALMSLVASLWMVRQLRELADSARAIARGEPGSGLATARTDEIGTLAGSLKALSENIEHTVSELAHERARFKAVLEGMSEGVIALDQRGCVTLMNPASLEMLGIEKAPLGKRLGETVQLPALQELVDAPRVNARGSAEIDLADGQRRVLADVAPQPGGDGCVVVLHDISTVRRLEVMRRDFVANVSHELRTPVSVIRANAETLLDGALEDPEHARPLLEALHRNSERMTRIISDLLDLSRLESGRYGLHRDAVDVRAAAEHAADAVERAAAKKQTRLEIEAPAGLQVLADAKAFDQVLVNLLDNAVKYTPTAGFVRVLAHAQRERVVVEIHDTGPGIPEHHRMRVFERFYRIDPGRSRDMGGTGLGLSIVKHLVEAMHGRVGVRGGERGGAVFWVELPAAAGEASPSRSGQPTSHT